MAAANHIYIYIGKKGTPTILNVDNKIDGEALEKLGAIKMPESMANEVFGNNIRYADNTTCAITETPDNSDFPFAVNFDASKIPAKPKRDTEIMSGLGMPGSKYIDLQQHFIQNSNGTWVNSGTAPANGYLQFHAIARNMTAGIAIHAKISSYIVLPSTAGSSVFVPVKKGQNYQIDFYNSVDIQLMRFVYAEGEL